MPFAFPIIWTEQTSHSVDCYFYLTDTKGVTIKIKSKTKCLNLPSAKRPIPLSVLEQPQSSDLAATPETIENTHPHF